TRDPLAGEAGEQPLAVAQELAVALPRRHVAAQLIRLAPGVSRPFDGDLHHLLLEERDAQRALEDGCEIRMRHARPLLTVAAPEVRVDHAALNRPGPDDRDLDDQMVEAPRSE